MDQIEKTTEIPTLLTPVSETSEDIPTENSQPPHPVREARVALEKLISRMDGLEVEFDKMAERSSTYEPPVFQVIVLISCLQ
jgi:hypothetical protein